MARTGDAAGAKREVESMEALRAALQKSDQSYWASRTEEQMLAVSAWIALAEGNRAQAEKLMRAAANSEDGSVKHVTMENRLYPLRELLAELLLEMGSPRPRCASSKPRSRPIPTAIAASTALRARRRPRETGRKPGTFQQARRR